MAAEQRSKNRSCWTHEWIGRRPELGFTATLVLELENEDAAEYRTMFRIDLTAFEELLLMVKPLIEKPDTERVQALADISRSALRSIFKLSKY